MSFKGTYYNLRAQNLDLQNQEDYKCWIKYLNTSDEESTARRDIWTVVDREGESISLWISILWLFERKWDLSRLDRETTTYKALLR